MKKVLGMALLLLLVMAGSAPAAEMKKAALQVSILSPVQIVRAEESMAGLRLNLLYSDNYNVSGLTLAAGWNKTRGDGHGAEFGLANWTEGYFYGWKAGLIDYVGMRFVGVETAVVNVNKGDSTGIQWGAVNWNNGYFHGWQSGIVNYQGGRFVGLQAGVMNMNSVSSSGLQLGAVNYVGGVAKGIQVGGLWNFAEEMHGLQIGLINVTNSLNGLQIGLGNYNGRKEPLEFMPIVNWSF